MAVELNASVFQSSLPVTGERVSVGGFVLIKLFKFQSSLPVTGERVVLQAGDVLWDRGFNPRSPSPGSVSFEDIRRRDESTRFNPRSPSPGSVSADRRAHQADSRRFNPRSPSPGSVSLDHCPIAAKIAVSILAPRHRGACPCWCSCCQTSRWSFQSSLPVTGERVRF